MAYSPKDIANWFIHRASQDGEYLTQMKLQKLVYIAHGWNLGLYNEPLISGNVEAWQWGPVIRPLYGEFVSFGSKPIVSDVAPPIISNQQDSDLLETVWEVYRRYTAAQLSALTHRDGTPWKAAYADGRKNTIPNDSIATHYRELAGVQDAGFMGIQ